MRLLRKDQLLAFDDVLLVPQYSIVPSRSAPDLSITLAGYIPLQIPILPANTDTITGVEMLKAVRDYGGWGYIHRSLSEEERISLASQSLPLTIGACSEEVSIAEKLLRAGCRDFCVDIAHADSVHGLMMVERLYNWSIILNEKITICAGNVCTVEGALRLVEAGAHIIKCGIGPGSICTTRKVTGHGYPQLSAIIEVAAGLEGKASLIADGGIRSSGDIVKALAAGADAVMVGRLLAGCEETPGPVLPGTEGSGAYKVYRGMASEPARKDRDPHKSWGAPEGISCLVPYQGPVQDVLSELADGVRSGLSYSGAHSIKDLQERATFAIVK